MSILTSIIDFVLHIDIHLGEIIAEYGLLSYAILFIIIFSETGLVVTPFLPGDSLLFAAGAFSAIGSFNIFVLLALLWFSAFLGDTVNYLVGKYLGAKIIANPRIPINQNHIDKTQRFYDKHGGKTIFLARFVPIVRTFAPFVAVVGKMDYGKFVYFNVIGGFVWVFGFTLLGYFFGNVPFVKDNFSLVIFAIIFLSILPIVVEYVRSKTKVAMPLRN